MALRWVVHTACNVLGYQNGANIHCKSRVVAYQNEVQANGVLKGSNSKLITNESAAFQMPLHYPRYSKADYEKMEEWRVDMLLREYGLSYKGTLDEKRAYAMGAFLWPDQY